MANKTSITEPKKGKKFRERVDAVFSDSTVSASDYLDTLRDNWKQLESEIKQSALFLLIFVSIFELLTRANIAELSLAGFKISDVSLIHRILPIIIAYYCHNIMYQGVLRKKYEKLHKVVVQKVYPTLNAHNLETYLTPQYGSLTNDDFLAAPRSLLKSILRFLSAVTALTIFISLVGFQFYAFYRLFNAFGYTDVIVWASLVISALFIIRALLLSQAPLDE